MNEPMSLTATKSDGLLLFLKNAIGDIARDTSHGALNLALNEAPKTPITDIIAVPVAELYEAMNQPTMMAPLANAELDAIDRSHKLACALQVLLDSIDDGRLDVTQATKVLPVKYTRMLHQCIGV